MNATKFAARLLMTLAMLVTLLGGAVTSPGTASAATIIYVNASAPAGGDGTSWGTAYNDLGAALTAAAGGQIWVAAGTYSGVAAFTLKNGVAIYGGFAGGETDLSQRNSNPTTNGTILSGGNTHTVVTAPAGTDSSAMLDGFTITGGNATSGGGMYVYGGSPALTNVLFKGNTANIGGGMYVASDGSTTASPTLVNVAFVGNAATGGSTPWGGGMFVQNVSNVTLTNVSFGGNSAGLGGGILAMGGSAVVNARNSVLWGNTATSGTPGEQQIYRTLAPVTVRYSDVQGSRNGSGSWTLTGVTDGGNNIASDPKFADPAGGDLRLKWGSGVVDSGNNGFLPAGVTTDLAGLPRFVDGNGDGTATVDMGAYERNFRFYVRAGAPAGGDGTSWAKAFTDLQSGLAAARPISADDPHEVVEVWVAAGTYNPGSAAATFTLKNGVAVYGGFPAAGEDWGARNPASNATVLNGGGATNHVVTAPSDVSSSALLDGFTITGGNATDAGGGMLVYGSPTVSSVVFRGNTAPNGGGLHIASGIPLLANLTFYGNSADSGGGVYVSGGTPTIANSILWGDTATTGQEIYEQGGTATVEYSDVQGGWAGTGNVNSDPLFVNSSAGDLTLQAHSPAIDAGNNDLVPTWTLVSFSSQVRFRDDLGTLPNVSACDNPPVDMGAYEFQGVTPVDWGAIYVREGATAGTRSGQSWDNAFTDLESALTLANSGQDVRVAAGTYYPTCQVDRNASFVMKPGVGIYGGYPAAGGDARDWTTNVTTLSGDLKRNDAPGDTIYGSNRSDDSYHVVRADGTVGRSGVLDGFTITRGNRNENDGSGGGMYITGTGSPTVANVIFSDNMANQGAGMYVAGGNPALTNVTFSGNRAEGAIGGGGLYIDGGSPVLSDVTFTGNSTTGVSGGGAIYEGAGSPTLTDVTITNNSSDGAGGGMLVQQGNPTLTNVTFAGNTSQTDGGGLYIAYNGATLTNVAFVDNESGSFGGGILDYASSLTLTNVTFSGNSAAGNGGALSVFGQPAPLNGGPAVPGSATLTNCILWGNTAAGAPEIHVDGSDPATASVSYSDVQGSGGSSSWALAGATDGGHNIDSDPLFVDAAAGDVHLQGSPTASPAIDAGSNSAVPSGVTTDLDGNDRIANGTVDMGAYEYATITTTAAQITSEASITFTVGSAGTFTITATGTPTPTITQTGTLPDGVSFVDNGNGTATLSGTPASGSGGAYPLTITASNGISPDATQSFTLTVDEAPSVTTQPESTTVIEGGTAVFTATAGGYPAPTVQWQVSTDSGTSFTDIGWATSTSLQLTGVTLSMSGNQYRAVFSNAVGEPAMTGAATLAVTAANNAPVAGDVAASTSQDTPVTVTLSASDADPGDVLAYSIVTGTTHGTLSAVNGNQVTYTPNTGYWGTDTFTFKANDGKADSNTATVRVTVSPAGDERWSALSSGVNGTVYATVADGNGNVYVGGDFTIAGGVSANYIAKWNGTSWSTLGSGTDSTVFALALDAGGNLYAGGAFTTAGGVSANYIAKWNGTSWSTLGSGMDFYVSALEFDASGNLYAGGWFTAAGGSAANRIAKWDGSSWSALGTGMNDIVSALAFDGSGNLYAGGYFTTAGGLTVNHVAKWNGASWSALGTGVNGNTLALAFDGSGNLYAGGQFTIAGGGPALRIAKWDGTRWSPLSSGFNNNPLALAFDGSGTLYAGGYFTTAEGRAASRIARWNGTSWTALGSGTNGVVNALAVGGDYLYAGGQFTTAGQKAANSVARWALGAAPANQAPVASDITDITTTQDTAVVITLNATDADGDTLTYSIVSGPSNGTLSEISGTDNRVTYTPNSGYAGADTFTFKANDGKADSNVATVYITVNPPANNPPEFTLSTGSVTVDEDFIGTQQVTPTLNHSDAGQIVTWSIATGSMLLAVPVEPATVTIDPDTGVVSITAIANANGTQTYTVTADDGSGAANSTYSQSFTLTVNAVNDAPVLDPIGNKSGDVESEIAFTATATDVDSATLTFSLEAGTSGSVPVGATISASTGTFTWTPSEAQGAGDYTFDVCVSDGDLSDCETITITVNAVNHAPVVASAISDVTADQDAADTVIDLSGVFSDPDGDALTLSVSNNSNESLLSATISGTSLTLYYLASQYGQADITVTATDPSGLAASDTFHVTVNAVNELPVLSSIEPNTAQAGGGDITLTVNGSGFVSGSVVRWNGANLITTFVSSTQITASVPAANIAAVSTAEITVFNPAPGGGSSAVMGFFLTSSSTSVTSQDTGTGSDPKASTDKVTAIGTGEGTVIVAQYSDNPGGTALSTFASAYFDVYVSSDSSLTSLTVRACNLNGASTIYWWSGTQWVSVSPQSYDSSTGCVTMTLDGSSTPSIGQLHGSIFAGAINTEPVANPLSTTTTQDTPVSITLDATDADGDPLTYSIVSEPSHGKLSEVSGKEVTYTPDAGYTGPDSFTYKAKDGKADSNVATVSIQVTLPSGLVVLSPNGGEILPVGSTYRISWQALAGASRYNIRYSQDGGTTWLGVANHVVGTSYSWKVPSVSSNKTECLVEVTALSSTGVTLGKDTSNAFFTIQKPVSVVAPNGGEQLQSGSTYNIQWETGQVPRSIAKIVVQYSSNWGSSWTQITALTGGANPGSYDWTVPNLGGTKPNCKVKVSFYDSRNALLASDDSDSYFTIYITATPPVITSAHHATFTVGHGGSFNVTTTGNPVPSLSQTGTLPGGVKFADNGNGTATLSGTPDAGTGGTYDITVTASNGISPDDSQDFSLTVNEAPSVTTQPESKTVAEGETARFTAAGSGYPAPTVLWQVSTDNGAHFTDIRWATSTTLELTGVTERMSGNQYRAVFSNGVGRPATTDAATLTVTRTNHPPVVDPVSATTNHDTAVSITLDATDADGDPLTYSIVSEPSHGKLSEVSGKEVTYTPDAGYTGPDSFTYKAKDGKADSNVATVSIQVTLPSGLVVLSPNGGEILPVGSTYRISWQALAGASRYNIRYSQDGGTTWLGVANHVVGTSYSWKVPSVSSNKTECLVEVTALSSTGVTLGKDTSNAFFTIQKPVSVVAPNGGEQLQSGSTYNIQWETGQVPRSIAKIVVQYSSNWGSSWTQITALTGGANPGSYDWTVPNLGGTKPNCKVKVSFYDSRNALLASDDSDSYFTIYRR